MIAELTIDQLRKACDPKEIGCDSSAEISTNRTIIGQERAVRALQFGLGIREKGFNIFVAGMHGTGRTTAVERYLEEVARDAPAPSDWCYVNNFRDSVAPRALRLTAGAAAALRAEMASLVNAALREIRSAFEGEAYPAQREETLQSFQQQKQALLQQLNEKALTAGFLLQSSPMGVLTVPMRKGKPLSEEEFMTLSKEEREAIGRKQEEIQDDLAASLRQVKALDKSAQAAVQKLDDAIAEYAIRHLFEEMEARYAQQPDVAAYLEEVRKDMVANQAQFRVEPEEKPTPASPFAPTIDSILKRYQVNPLVGHSATAGAPVVLERNPTYNNLFGRIEHEARFGALSTDFTLLRGGSMHRANGGYLVLPAEEVLRNPFAWEALKHALMNNEIVIEDPGERAGLVSTRSLQPEPIPLEIKVVLIGSPDVYQALLRLDEHFNELFKVKADFDTRMERSEDHIRAYAAFVSTLCKVERLRHLSADAIARLVEHGSRLVEDQSKLSTHFGVISDVIREANYYAVSENAENVGDVHIRRAIDERFYRSSMVRDRIQELINKQVIKIDVSGSSAGQVNGLSVLQMGDITFGQPNRITVSVGMGREGIIDIEREARLGGPIHTKGVMILSGYLLQQYAQDKPLSLTAHLVFEQSYAGVDGDSASITELYAILSALSGAPIRQGIAVTGSVNQRGEVQAIGGVNEKVEGFFEVCRAAGLTGEQGVLIPHSNASNLMLRQEVVDAVRAGLFHVWPVQTIDEGIEVLTGMRAGLRREDGGYEEGTIHALVDQRLRRLAEQLEQFSEQPKEKSIEPVVDLRAIDPSA